MNCPDFCPQAHATSVQARDFSRFQEQLQLEVADIVSQQLAKLKPAPA